MLFDDIELLKTSNTKPSGLPRIRKRSRSFIFKVKGKSGNNVVRLTQSFSLIYVLNVTLQFNQNLIIWVFFLLKLEKVRRVKYYNLNIK